MGSSINSNKGYATKYADIATLSFHPVKAITTGEGGALLTNNRKIYKKANLLRQHGILRNNNSHWNYKVNVLGYNFRLPDINCALGISQLKKLDKYILQEKKYLNFMINYLLTKQSLRLQKK